MFIDVAFRDSKGRRVHFQGSSSAHVRPLLNRGQSHKEKNFLLYFSMNYRDFSVKSKMIISLFQTVKLSISISLFLNTGFSGNSFI